ncbi:hypothetical protein [Streptomyces hesseae]|uniref:Uncharacterized protein n=1 Tax=Streptomyces hesseae TaxID=3075519 RepID=A0ABU2SLV0_9ACTN|nr:hypothetical protein [Streptomyces sp. DSM 40473]MDT0449964.1 hypothetical protein [Streptomyces sp. DSM 40473]
MITPSKKSPGRIAGDAADLIQALNHATFSPSALPYPPLVSETAQAVVRLVDRIPQSLEQLTAAVRLHAATGLIRMDDGIDPTEAAGQVIEALNEAVHAAGKLSGSLHRAASVLFSMGTAETQLRTSQKEVDV